MCHHFFVTSTGKQLDKLKHHPQDDWHIDQLEAVARRYDVSWHQTGSHVTFRAPDGRRLTIPAHRPVKAVYVHEFARIIDDLDREGGEHESRQAQ